MPDEPLITLDPERLREERGNVDLGETETGFDQVTRDERASQAEKPALDEPTSGITPPAR